MRHRMSVLTILAGVWLLTIGVMPAVAGGPTSVLLVAPGSGRSASLYYSDPDYDTLYNLLTSSSGASAVRPEDVSWHRFITVTWLIHDVSVWRIDRIVPDSRRGVVVATYQSDQGGKAPTPSLDANAPWRVVNNSPAVLRLLGGLGVLGSDPAPVDHEVSVPDPPTTAPQPPASVQATHSAAIPSWTWGAGGFVAGALLAIAGLVLIRRMAGPPEPAGEWASEIYLEPEDRPVS